MSHEVLWAPWRMAYVGAPKIPGCIFCRLPEEPDPREALVLVASDRIAVVMNRFPYANGHIMVAPRAHVADLALLSDSDHLALAEALRRSVSILRDVFRPEGLNVGLNLGAAAGAGVADHLHWHIVPRWIGDTNFMPLIGEVRVIPEHLEAVYDRLQPHFQSLAAASG